MGLRIDLIDFLFTQREIAPGAEGTCVLFLPAPAHPAPGPQPPSGTTAGAERWPRGARGDGSAMAWERHRSAAPSIPKAGWWATKLRVFQNSLTLLSQGKKKKEKKNFFCIQDMQQTHG